jgi:TPP-dependent pyruvate/acetoin dehydrogenase alpha subunit
MPYDGEKIRTLQRGRHGHSREAQGESRDQDVSAEEMLRYYRGMLLIRRFEEKAGQMYGMGLIGGFCHLYIGQEAVVVGMQTAHEAGRPGHHRLPRPWPHAGLRHGSARASWRS